MQTHISNKQTQKDDFTQLYNSITSTVVLTDDTEISTIKSQHDELIQQWTSISTDVSSAMCSLEPAMKLARSYERERDRMTSWVKMASSEVTSLGSIPSAPEDVQELKIKIDVS